MDAEFIISGGGIGGTVLAHLLARGGKKVLVIEKALKPPTFVRPEGLWPETAALLKTLLPNKSVGEAWIPLKGLRAYEGERELLSETEENFDHAGVTLAMTDPNQTREQLLKLGTFELKRGVEVIGVLKDGSRITGVKTKDTQSGVLREYRAPWTIGDDGVNSRIREACGIALHTQIFPVDFMAFGFAWPKSLPQAVVNIFLNKERTKTGIVALAAFPMPQGRGAALLPVRGKAFDRVQDQAGAWKRFLAQNPQLAKVGAGIEFPQKVARIQRPWGHAERYGTDGAALMGDAAHPVSPVGGQGANMSVADARVLAEVFLSGKKKVIEEYEKRRRPANERSVSFTRRGAQLLNLPAVMVNTLLPLGLRWINGHPETFERGVKAASRAFAE